MAMGALVRETDYHPFMPMHCRIELQFLPCSYWICSMHMAILVSFQDWTSSIINSSLEQQIPNTYTHLQLLLQRGRSPKRSLLFHPSCIMTYSFPVVTIVGHSSYNFDPGQWISTAPRWCHKLLHLPREHVIVLKPACLPVYTCRHLFWWV